MKKLLFSLIVIILTISLSGCTSKDSNSEDKDNSENTSNNEETTEEDPEGTIVVDVLTGTLTGAEPSTRNFIQELESGPVAYLGSKDVSANYTVTSPTAGTYSLRIKTSDDGLWDSGSRDSTIFVNGVNVLGYHHTSENTNGWKWFTLGNISLHEGENTIVFTKANDMPAAFSMTQFKLIPVILE